MKSLGNILEIIIKVKNTIAITTRTNTLSKDLVIVLTFFNKSWKFNSIDWFKTVDLKLLFQKIMNFVKLFILRFYRLILI